MRYQMAVGLLSLALALASSQSRQPVPQAILKQIPTDLRLANEDLDCLREKRTGLTDISSSARLRLRSEGEQYLARLAGACLAGANNSRLLVYTREADRWMLVLNVGGNRLRVLSAEHGGWHDIAVLGHLSVAEQIETVYRYTGTRYDEVHCSIIQTENTVGKLNPPLVHPCTTESRMK